MKIKFAQSSIEIMQNYFKLQYQVTSTLSSTSFLIPLPPLHGHLLPSSALANTHMWANLGQAH